MRRHRDEDEEPFDPFDDDDVSRIVNDFGTGKIHEAIAASQDELDGAVEAVAMLTHKLHSFLPPSAVISLVSSMAVDTAVTNVFGTDMRG